MASIDERDSHSTVQAELHKGRGWTQPQPLTMSAKLKLYPSRAWMTVFSVDMLGKSNRLEVADSGSMPESSARVHFEAKSEKRIEALHSQASGVS